jgi:hypothetical protein
LGAGWLRCVFGAHLLLNLRDRSTQPERRHVRERASQIGRNVDKEERRLSIGGADVDERQRRNERQRVGELRECTRFAIGAPVSGSIRPISARTDAALVRDRDCGEELAEAAEGELHRDVEVRLVHESIPAAVDRRLAHPARRLASELPRRVPEVAIRGARDARLGALAEHRVAARAEGAPRVDLAESAHLHEEHVRSKLRRHRRHIARLIHRDEAARVAVRRRRREIARVLNVSKENAGGV